MQAQETEIQQPVTADVPEQPYETLQVHPLAPRELIERVYWYLAEEARRDRPGIEGAERVAQLNAAYFELVEASRRRNSVKKRRLAPVPQEPEPVSLWGRVQRKLSGEETAPQVLVDPYDLLKIDRAADSAIIRIAYDYARAQTKGPTLDRVEALRRVDDAYALVMDFTRRSAFDEAHPLPVLNPQTEDGAHVAARIQQRDATRDDDEMLPAEDWEAVAVDEAPVPTTEPENIVEDSSATSVPQPPTRSIVEPEPASFAEEGIDATEMVRRAIDEAERAFAAAPSQILADIPAPYDDAPEPVADLTALRHAIELEPEVAPGAPDEVPTLDEQSDDLRADAAVEQRIASLAAIVEATALEAPVIEAPALVADDDPPNLDDDDVTIEQPVDIVEAAEPERATPVVLEPAAWQAPADEPPAIATAPKPIAATATPPVPRAPLLRGLVSRIGRQRDRFDDSGLPPIPPQSEEETPELARIRARLRRLNSEAPTPSETRPAAFEESPRPASTIAAFLVFVGGDRSGQSVALDGDLITLGTSPRSRVILPDNSGAIEREHARIWRHGDHFMLREANGSGTLIGGLPLEAPTVVLEDRDVIAIGPHRLRFSIAAPSAE